VEWGEFHQLFEISRLSLLPTNNTLLRAFQLSVEEDPYFGFYRKLTEKAYIWYIRLLMPSRSVEEIFDKVEWLIKAKKNKALLRAFRECGLSAAFCLNFAIENDIKQYYVNDV
jgi:hypothetical protein